MTDREDFLSRWSRRKRDAEKESASEEETKQLPAAESAQPIADEAAPDQDPDVSESADDHDKKEKGESAFDLSKLPSLDSITAETDIRPFMAAGVPMSLRQAALRRVWVADPAIRDFIGIAENQWDFTPGGNAPGFDFSPPVGDVKRMVAEIFGGKREPEAPESAADIEPDRDAIGSVRQSSQAIEDVSPGARDHFPVTDVTAEPGTDNRRAESDSASEDSRILARKRADVASQNNDASQQNKIQVVARWPHGRAMPK